jgi:hypothetical protein
MTKLKSILGEKKEAIVKRWLENTTASYAPETSAFLNRGKDRFANPVGHALRAGTRAIFESILDGMETDRICRHLDDIIRIRAIQDFSPSQAVSFVFLLKKAVRVELGKEAEDPRLLAELTELDADIDRIALLAFDVYTKCREQLCEIRVSEIKRSVAAVMERFNRSDSDSASARDRSETKSKCTNEKRGTDR